MATDEFGDVETPSVEVKLFGKWSADEVHVNDISLAVSAMYMSPHAMGYSKLGTCMLSGVQLNLHVHVPNPP